MLPPQPPWVFSIRGLRLYFPTLEPWVQGLLLSPRFVPVYLCVNVWPWSATRCSAGPFSATLSPALSVYLCSNVGPQGLLVVGLPASFVAHSASLGPTTATRVLSTPVPVSAPPTGLDKCFFFISLVVGLPYSSIFCQFWLFLFLNCCCPSLGCARRHSVSTYASILVLEYFKCNVKLYFLKHKSIYFILKIK